MSGSTTLLIEIGQSWGWTGIAPVQVVKENPFGNLLAQDTNGKYWRLCPEEVSCEIIAESKLELDLLFEDRSFLDDWYMTPLVSLAEDLCGPLPKNRKYHPRVPVVLCGDYGGSNLVTVDQIDQLRFSGDIGRQIKDLPDGSEIELKVVE
ncbi:MAG: DUF1851 domain-containing protein [Burkholderiaceae bacterium]|nr:MAG: DUF1851 domain-containing protein [Burkholderiaceae bacterium]